MDMTVSAGNQFYKGRLVGRASKEQEKAYRDYVAACDAERSAAMSFKDWVKAGELSLTELKVKWHQDYVAEMKSRYGDDWAPEVESAEPGETGKAKKGKRVKMPNPSAGATKRVWVIADQILSEATGSGEAAVGYEKVKEFRAKVMAACEAAGINKGTVQVQLGKWKKERAA